jgi:hypothetical protein
MQERIINYKGYTLKSVSGTEWQGKYHKGCAIQFNGEDIAYCFNVRRAKRAIKKALNNPSWRKWVKCADADGAVYYRRGQFFIIENQDRGIISRIGHYSLKYYGSYYEPNFIPSQSTGKHSDSLSYLKQIAQELSNGLFIDINRLPGDSTQVIN